VISPTQRPLPDNTQHSQETDIHATSGTRTRIPRKRKAADRRLRPRGHWDRRKRNLVVTKTKMPCFYSKVIGLGCIACYSTIYDTNRCLQSVSHTVSYVRSLESSPAPLPLPPTQFQWPATPVACLQFLQQTSRYGYSGHHGVRDVTIVRKMSWERLRQPGIAITSHRPTPPLAFWLPTDLDTSPSRLKTFTHVYTPTKFWSECVKGKHHLGHTSMRERRTMK
jgi:hypothetical protein